ncbi:molybdopterin-dependent oxidoreductase [Sphingomonas naphthae]|uniref:Molybdopterin-dependent oxidoreductase n=1 Tax=Sphingomonas naphthae TaxID=1813468 RepID=A0ABY7TFD8_9SPHN|nr:molybdopterin cofactor-binding domain-containing protein [Sphingomonas naphthae]WCT71956.1 molybdopterin-dependent oxidoreductase [Sphingomonas naphthae]
MGYEQNITRRAALAAGGALVVGFHLMPQGAHAQAAPGDPPPPANPNAFLRIGADDTVTVISKHIEFGQGPYTGLATMACEELDADWSQMRATSAPADAKLYGNAVMGGIQGTGGSSAMASSFDQMRGAAAAARAMLVLAAAKQWGVDPATITVDKGVIAHRPSKRSGRFGQFAAAAATLPAPPRPTLKDPKDYKFIGRDHVVGKVDSAAKVNGSAKFTIDQAAPGMLTVVVARPALFGAKIDTFDGAAALKVKGVVAVRKVSSGVAVYATGTWPALKARRLIEAKWNEAAAETRGTEDMLVDYRASVTGADGRVVNQHGDVEAGLATGQRHKAEFVFPYLAHAPMEPLDGFLEWDGKTAVARFGCQMQTADHAAIAKVLGLPQDKVTIETLLAGGSFGRRAQSDAELAVELAEAARAIGPGKPVKLVRTREDDITGGYYRPLALHTMEGSIEGGVIKGWKNHIVCQSFIATSPFAAAMMKDGIDPTMSEGASELPYRTENFRCMAHTVDSPVPTLWWRSVGHTHTGYAVECFVDRLLQADGRDPVEGRLALIDNPRFAGVLKAVAKLARWNGPGPVNGRARGVAVVESFGSFVAQIAEVSLAPDGTPKVHKVWAAVDLGVAINPDIIRAQLEGGIGYALGHALYAEVPLEGGRPTVANFDTYRSLRIHEMPEVEVVIVPSTEKPTGIGEPGVPPLAPAVANAMARLGRERPTRLPMVRA